MCPQASLACHAVIGILCHEPYRLPCPTKSCSVLSGLPSEQLSGYTACMAYGSMSALHETARSDLSCQLKAVTAAVIA